MRYPTLTEIRPFSIRSRRDYRPVRPDRRRESAPNTLSPSRLQEGDFAEIQGQEILNRALEIAAAGAHNVIIFGPPGSGKTMSARRFTSILPDLSRDESLSVTRIHSLAGTLPGGSGIIRRPPFRSPHHSSSAEGVIGGGRTLKPGEVSLAHKGVLFLDEAPEFRKPILQALREPLERYRVELARAGNSCWFPADFQLILAANACPCGNLGKENGVCVCSRDDVARHWRRIGWALMDRIDIRIPVRPAPPGSFLMNGGESSASVGIRVERAMLVQRERYHDLPFSRNARITPGYIETFCSLDSSSSAIFRKGIEKLSLSSRSAHSVLKVARTIADLEGSVAIGKEHLLEAFQHRRYGDGDFFWRVP
jgi:magnesium chelatase family protein